MIDFTLHLIDYSTTPRYFSRRFKSPSVEKAKKIVYAYAYVEFAILGGLHFEWSDNVLLINTHYLSGEFHDEKICSADILLLSESESRKNQARANEGELTVEGKILQNYMKMLVLRDFTREQITKKILKEFPGWIIAQIDRDTETSTEKSDLDLLKQADLPTV